ncbi:trihelix transcription factor DF1-like [Rhodamnia argentea]|uniref:Trihelix transcription factor DF1-like n=1 Tax=Rhodamnia argentea TaxID=178133 RepID=A0A8B8R2Q7_9MYRT|nr:trihelix transcription factor DF1-like [Rhodamnia argentea]
MASSGDAAVAREGAEGGGDNNSSAELYESERGEQSGFGGGGGGGGGAGNRWPRQETLALLKIRSDMDAVFRDASVKGPLWEEVSRKLGELGFHRSAKKCKEKFENVYKYHKRTKDGRTGKHEKKTYRFFDQLEALENLSPSPCIPPPPPQMAAAAASTAGPPFTVTSVTTHHHITMPQFNVPPPTAIVPPAAVPSLATNVAANPARGSGVASSALPNMPGDLGISDASVPSSSSTSSDEELGRPPRRGTKRKWRGFFERLTKEVMDKQEAMHRKFLEVIEKREHERMAREEAWRVQEIARISREREILAQERSAAAAKDAAVMSFLQKIAEQQIPGKAQANPSPTPLQPQQPVRQVPNLSPPQPVPAPTTTPGEIIRYSQAQSPAVTTEIHRSTNNGDNQAPPSSSRWPKVEVEALIKLRSNLESKYQENGPKGPLWEEISEAMRKLGYNRSSKRCKEKWENINKYFKKVKESNKQRPEDSKTCPYFHQLDALYKEKSYKFEALASQLLKPESSMAPLMVMPEQQWPPPPAERRVVDSTAEDMDSDRNHDEEEGDEDDEEEGDYEVVANKPSSAGANSEDTHDC